MSRVDQLFDYTRHHHPRALKGLEEAARVHPERFALITERMLERLEPVLGAAMYERSMGAFVRFSEGVILSQARYERSGAYENQSYDEVNASLYSQRSEMDDYLWGVYLTNTLWAHHMELTLFYIDRFLGQLGDPQRPLQIVEFAPGHGGWGQMALEALPQASLRGYDISPSSMAIARSLAAAAGLDSRAEYHQRDALKRVEEEGALADLCVCNFLVEHLEDPQALLHSIAHVLKPKGRAFFSGALTAAQIDHIYEFTHESELMVLAEKAGLRVLESMSRAPLRTLKRARFLPRSMSLILEKP